MLGEKDIVSIENPSADIKWSPAIVILRVEPSVIFKNVIIELKSTYEEVKVFVSEIPNIKGRLDCKFETIIMPSKGIGTDAGGNKYIICPIPLFPNLDTSLSSGSKLIQVEIMSCSNVIFTSVTPADRTIEFMEVPLISTITPKYIPRFIEYAPNQEIRDEHKLVITGMGFHNSITYY